MHTFKWPAAVALVVAFQACGSYESTANEHPSVRTVENLGPLYGAGVAEEEDSTASNTGSRWGIAGTVARIQTPVSSYEVMPCSATLVRRKILLTAAHCINQTKAPGVSSDWTVQFAQDRTTTFHIDTAELYPGNPGDWWDHDLAVLSLVESVPTWLVENTARVFLGDIDQALNDVGAGLSSDDVVIVGYGATEGDLPPITGPLVA